MNSLALLLLRLMFGLGLAWHGFQSLFIYENGMEGLAGLIGGQGWPAPMAMAYLAKLSELLCGLMVALGLFTRWGALVCTFVMGVAIFMTAELTDFGSWESPALYGIAFLALVFAGAGNISIDGLRKVSSRREAAALAAEYEGDLEEEEEMIEGTVVVDAFDRSSTLPPVPASSEPRPPTVPPTTA